MSAKFPLATIRRQRHRCVSGKLPLYLPHVRACHLQADLGRGRRALPADARAAGGEHALETGSILIRGRVRRIRLHFRLHEFL
jgi:hypothetical protein